jgi:DNA-binding MarR family transcriptional regulator
MAAMTALDVKTKVEFSYLRDLLKVTDGNLGAHLRKLEEAGYITVEKTFVNRKPRTTIATTPMGQHAFAEHVTTLASILNGE